MGLVTERGVGQYAAGQATETHYTARHRLYKTGGRGIIWCHSAAGTADEPFVAANNNIPILQKLVDLGGVVASIDAGGAHWGNDFAQARVGDAWAYLQSRYGVRSDKVVLCGVSMGGLLTLNWARANPTLVAGCALFFPAVNLQWVHDNGAQASTETAYGGAGGFTSAVAAHNPSAHPDDYTDLTKHMWYASNDTVVSTAQQTSFAAAASIPSINLGATGHANMAAVSLQSVVDFVDPLI